MSGAESDLAVQVFEPEPHAVFSIEAAERIAHVPRRAILIYCRHGLLAPVGDSELDGYYFDGDAIQTLRRIEFLRTRCGVNLAGVKMILRLINEVERLRSDVERGKAPTTASA